MQQKKLINITILSGLALILTSSIKFCINNSFDIKLCIFTAILLISSHYITTSITFQKINRNNEIICVKKQIYELFEVKSYSELKEVEKKFQEATNKEITQQIYSVIFQFNTKITRKDIIELINNHTFNEYISKFKINNKEKKSIKRLLRIYNTNYWFNDYYCDFKSKKIVNIPDFQWHLSYIVSFLLSFFAAFGYGNWNEDLLIKMVSLIVIIGIEIISNIIAYKILKEEEMKRLNNFIIRFKENSI